MKNGYIDEEKIKYPNDPTSFTLSFINTKIQDQVYKWNNKLIKCKDLEILYEKYLENDWRFFKKLYKILKSKSKKYQTEK